MLEAPLAIAGVVGLILLFRDWRIWVVVILGVLYVMADFVLTLDDVSDWKSRRDEIINKPSQKTWAK
jgi:hypothetical protein